VEKDEVERLIRKLKREKRKMIAEDASSFQTKKIRRAIKKLEGEK